MPKLISVHTNSEMVECPEKWNQYKNRKCECSIYASENKAPGKYWFYVVFDENPYSVDYFHCNLSDLTIDNGYASFDSISGSHYVIELGEEQPEDYVPYRVVGYGADAVLLPGTAALREIEELRKVDAALERALEEGQRD